MSVGSAMSSIQEICRRLFLQAVSPIMGKGFEGLFDTFTQIALQRYETLETSGILALCRPDWQLRTIPLVRLHVPFNVHDIRGVRKLLHISERRLCILCDGQMVYGFTTRDAVHPDTLLIRFQKHGVWELRQGGRTIAQVNAQDDALASIALSEDRFVGEIQRVFGALPPADVQHLWCLIEVANRQQGGTNVLISPCAATEAERLGSQCTRVRPIKLTPLLMERFTSVDGTVIIDTHGVCHAIGAILDGAATRRGDRTRGGRYNSAVMYVDSSPLVSFIVVVSQDGMIDLVYKLKDIAGQ